MVGNGVAVIPQRFVVFGVVEVIINSVVVFGVVVSLQSDAVVS